MQVRYFCSLVTGKFLALMQRTTSVQTCFGIRYFHRKHCNQAGKWLQNTEERNSTLVAGFKRKTFNQREKIC